MQIEVGRWRARLTGDGGTGDAGVVAAAMQMRAQAFRGGRPDGDAFDAAARHLLIEGPAGPAACARLMPQAGSAAVLAGYTAQFYDLTGFAAAFPSALEVGRVCMAPGPANPDAPRLLLAVLARAVVMLGARVLYGCSSFPAGTAVPARLLAHVAPPAWAPRAGAAGTRALTGGAGALPPLLRSYLSLGAMVSDHAVADPDLDTLHVFTALPVADIPPRRARLLRDMLAAA